MTERARFVALHQEGPFSMSELCRRFGVWRKCAYKWLDRYNEAGIEGLKDQSRAPHACPHQIAPPVEEALLQVRHAHPSWGPKKLLAYLTPRRPDLSLGAQAPYAVPSTVGELLRRQGLSQPRRRPARRWKHPGEVSLVAEAPNQTWCADFKGQFPTKDGKDCYPLTLSDAYSRFLVCCQALPSVPQEGTFPVFERAFQEFGLPQVIRTDNGVPFATHAITCALRALSASPNSPSG